MVTWKIITGSATAVLGLVIVVSVGVGEWRGQQGMATQVAHAGPAFAEGSTAGTVYSGTDLDNVLVAAGEIDVEGGTVPLSPSFNGGKVLEIPVQEGDIVKKGQPLVLFEARMAELQVDQAEAALAQANVALEQAEQASSTHKFKVEQLEQSVIAANARLQSAERQANKLESLRPKDTVSEETFLSAKDKLVELKAMVQVSKEQLAEAKQINPGLVVQEAEVAVSAARTKLAAARENLAHHTLTAPADGKVLRLQVGVGQVLNALDPRPLIWFCPDRPLIVRCEIEQEFADRIEPGMKVKVMNESFDGRKWVGEVRRCAPWVAPKRTLWNKVFQVSHVPTVECIVDLEPGQPPLRIGQRVRVAVEPATGTEAARTADSENEPS